MTRERPVRIKEVRIDLWGGPDTARNRPVRAQRPCPCGCDERNGDTIVGYVTGSDARGNGLTIYAPDEATYQRFVAVFGAARLSDFDDRGTGPDRYPTVLRDAQGRPTDVG